MEAPPILVFYNVSFLGKYCLYNFFIPLLTNLSVIVKVSKFGRPVRYSYSLWGFFNSQTNFFQLFPTFNCFYSQQLSELHFTLGRESEISFSAPRPPVISSHSFQSHFQSTLVKHTPIPVSSTFYNSTCGYFIHQ